MADAKCTTTILPETTGHASTSPPPETKTPIDSPEIIEYVRVLGSRLTTFHYQLGATSIQVNGEMFATTSEPLVRLYWEMYYSTKFDEGCQYKNPQKRATQRVANREFLGKIQLNDTVELFVNNSNPFHTCVADPARDKRIRVKTALEWCEQIQTVEDTENRMGVRTLPNGGVRVYFAWKD